MHRVLIPLWRMGSPAEARLAACGDTVHPQNEKRHPQKPRLAGGHCGGAWALLPAGALQPPRSGRRATRPGASGPAPPAARASRRRARVIYRDLPRRRAAVSGAARRPGSDYRFTRGARPAAAQPPPARPRAAPLPRLPILLHSCGRPAPPPPPPARPPSPPPAARIGWRPWRRHFPTARGACGSPAALQARPWRASRPIGARGAGRGRGRRRACVPARPPPPARRRPTAARTSSAPPQQRRPSGAPAEPTHRRRAGAGVEGGGGVRPRPEPRSGPSPERLPINGARSRLAEGRLLPWSRRPASPPPRPPPPPRLPSPGT